jgi:excisionase family DNA binding protein
MHDGMKEVRPEGREAHPRNDNEREIMTPEQVIDLLQISLSTLYKWTHMELIPHLKVGHALRFERSVIMQWLKKRRQTEKPRVQIDI